MAKLIGPEESRALHRVTGGSFTESALRAGLVVDPMRDDQVVLRGWPAEEIAPPREVRWNGREFGVKDLLASYPPPDVRIRESDTEWTVEVLSARGRVWFATLLRCAEVITTAAAPAPGAASSRPPPSRARPAPRATGRARA